MVLFPDPWDPSGWESANAAGGQIAIDSVLPRNAYGQS